MSSEYEPIKFKTNTILFAIALKIFLFFMKIFSINEIYIKRNEKGIYVKADGESFRKPN